MRERDWYNLYAEGWRNEIVPEAFGHPAKFSRGLIRRIYQHAIERGWLEAGDTVLDPFGGVALGALDAMRNGLRWTGIELEPRFCQLGQQNIDRWNARYARMWPDTWGTAMILQGDSRELASIVGRADMVASSPPYASGVINTADVSESDRAHRIRIGRNPDSPGSHGVRQPYSPNPSNLGNLRATDEGFEAVVGSPPWEASTPCEDPNYRENRKTTGGPIHNDYGNSPHQLGNASADDFWSASKTIMEQVAQVLKPDGVAIWVLKAFVRNKKIVNFPDQWRRIGESYGFETLEWIRAWLVEDKGTQYDFDGNPINHQVERKSFFRRLAENKGSPRIDYEVVLVQRLK